MTDLIFDFQNLCKIENLFSKKLENKRPTIYINLWKSTTLNCHLYQYTDTISLIYGDSFTHQLKLVQSNVRYRLYVLPEQIDPPDCQLSLCLITVGPMYLIIQMWYYRVFQISLI